MMTMTLLHSQIYDVQVKQKQVRQLSGLAYIHTCRWPIADHRETHSFQQRPSSTMRQNVFHSTLDGRQVCSTGRTSVERVIDFSIFDLGAYP